MRIHLGDIVRYKIGAGVTIYTGTVARLPINSAGYYLILPNRGKPDGILSYDCAYRSEIIEAIYSADTIREFLS